MASGGAFGHQEQLQQLQELRELEASNAALSLQVESLERRQMASRAKGTKPVPPGPAAWGGVPGSRLNPGQRALSMNAALLGALSSQAQALAALEQEQGAAGLGGGRVGRAPSPLGPGEDLMLVDGGAAGPRAAFAIGALQAGLLQGGDVVAPSALAARGNGGAGGKALLGSGSGRPPSGVPRSLVASPSLPAGTGKLGVPAGLPRPLPPHLQSLLAGGVHSLLGGGGGVPQAGGATSMSVAALPARLRPPGGVHPGMDMGPAAAAAAMAQSLERTSSAPPLGDLDLSALQSQLSDVSELERMYRVLREGAEGASARQGLGLAHLPSPSYASSVASSVASSPERESLRRLSSLGAQGFYPHLGPASMPRPPPPGLLGLHKGGAHLASQQQQQQQHQQQQGLLGRPSGASVLRERTKLSRTSSCPPLSESELEAAMHAGQDNVFNQGGLGAHSEANGVGGESEDGVGKGGARRKRARGGSVGGGLGAGAGPGVEDELGFLDALSGGAPLDAPSSGPVGARGKEKKGAKGEGAQHEVPSDVIHVRARRGQATDSHSLAERLRREKISDRMKVLQDLVPTCAKVTGKAMMLDEIINYVRSLQLQVELLSAKLAALSQAQDEQGPGEREPEAQRQSSGGGPGAEGAGPGPEAAMGMEAEMRGGEEAGAAALDALAGHPHAGAIEGGSGAQGDGRTQGESEAQGHRLGHPHVKQEPSVDHAYRHRSPDLSSSSMSGFCGGGETPVSSGARPGEGAERQGLGDLGSPDPSEHFSADLSGLFLRQQQQQLAGREGAGSQAPGTGPELDDSETDDILKLIADMGGVGPPFLDADWKLGQVKE